MLTRVAPHRAANGQAEGLHNVKQVIANTLHDLRRAVVTLGEESVDLVLCRGHGSKWWKVLLNARQEPDSLFFSFFY